MTHTTLGNRLMVACTATLWLAWIAACANNNSSPPPPPAQPAAATQPPPAPAQTPASQAQLDKELELYGRYFELYSEGTIDIATLTEQTASMTLPFQMVMMEAAWTCESRTPGAERSQCLTETLAQLEAKGPEFTRLLTSYAMGEIDLPTMITNSGSISSGYRAMAVEISAKCDSRPPGNPRSQCIGDLARVPAAPTPDWGEHAHPKQ